MHWHADILADMMMLPMHHIGKAPPMPICIAATFAHKNCYAIVLHRVFGNPSCFFVCDCLMQIICPVPCACSLLTT